MGCLVGNVVDVSDIVVCLIDAVVRDALVVGWDRSVRWRLGPGILHVLFMRVHFAAR
jgi:hypothetical protein